MSDGRGLTPMHRAVLNGDIDALRAMLPDKSLQSAKTTEMFHALAQGSERRIFRPASATFYPPTPVDDIPAGAAFDKGSNPLHLAASLGHVEMVDALLAHRSRPKTRDGVGATALHLAALGGHGPVVDRLLREKIDVDTGTKTRKSLRFLDVGTTPLMAALEAGDLAIVERLLERGADPHARTKAGLGTVLFAARGGSVACLDRLVREGVRVDDPPQYMNFPLVSAVEGGHLEMAQRLLELGAPSETSSGNQAPLRAAIERDDRVMRRALLDAGVRPLPDHGIESAIRGNDYHYVLNWLDAGSDPDDGGKGSHLWLAAALGRTALVELLLERGADVNAHRGRGTALHVAFQNGHPKVADLLLQARPDCSIADEHGNEVLVQAIFTRHRTLEQIATMLDLGASPHSKGRGGQSVLEMAAELDDPELMSLLEASDSEGGTDRGFRHVGTSAVLANATAEDSWKRLHAALWDELVPPRHEAQTVQGELIRCIGNLTDEAYRNGNINFGPRHRGMAETLRSHLLDGTFDGATSAELTDALRAIARAQPLDLSGDGSPHYRVNEAVVRWCLAHRQLIPR